MKKQLKKSFVILIVIFFGVLPCKSLRAQYVDAFPETCKSWAMEMHKIVSAKERVGGMSITISYDLPSSLLYEDVEISWNEKLFTVDGVSFNVALKRFEQNGRNLKGDEINFSKLEAIRKTISKICKKVN